ncbi:MAG: cyclase family protein, partial [Gluconacetobacter diazotrophicus]|nr:cyclase family protein [Gluconacetobacter diazotrophicus]
MAVLHDISQRLRVGMPCWPGDTTFAARRTWSIGDGCPVNVSAWGGSTHLGTHADAPLHYDARAAAIDTLPLEPFLGPALLVDARCGGTRVTL